MADIRTLELQVEILENKKKNIEEQIQNLKTLIGKKKQNQTSMKTSRSFE